MFGSHFFFVMTFFFHPHVTSSFAFLFRGVVCIGVRHCVVAVVTFMVVVIIFLHPRVTSSFALLFIVNVLVGVV